MTATIRVSYRRAASSPDWLRYFESNASEPALPWQDAYRLTPAELSAVAASIAQFQLGESGDGRRLLRHGERLSRRLGQPELLEALRFFVKEEQRHSRLMGRFLEMHGVPLLKSHWVDHAFRRIRGLAGAELNVRVLATAEVLAMSYFRALREATASPLLRAICSRILADEAAHIRFQAFAIRLLQGNRTALLRRIAWIAHSILLRGTAIIVWREHRPVFIAAGFSRAHLHAESVRWFRELREQAGLPAAPPKFR
jgi:hypothetical protein